jgi:tetratricopeptide (TPR) repeat protein
MKDKIESYGLYVILLLTIALRVLYWLQAHQAFWFAYPGMDPEFYNAWANAILSGRASDYIPFPRAPLYPYLLAGLKSLFGNGWLVPRMFNLAADLITFLIIFKITKKISGKITALIAALLFSVCGISIYFSGEMLMTSAATACAAGFVLTFANCIEKPTRLNSALSGVMLALLTLFRPNAMIILPFSFIIFLMLSFFRHVGARDGTPKSLDSCSPIVVEDRLRRNDSYYIASSLLHLLFFILLLAPVSIVNFNASGKFIPVSTQGGVNFYIGNAAGADGWSSKLPGAGANWSDNDALSIAESHAGKMLKSHEVSSQMWRMGIAEIGKSPLRWLKLELKKLLILLNIREIGNNRPLSLSSNTFPPLKLLFFISLGLLFPFALVGIFQIFQKPETKSMVMFIILFGGSLLLFFVNSRYRMPLMPMIASLSAVGIAAIINEFKTKKRSMRTAGLLILGFAISLPPWAGSSFDNRAQAYFIEGNAALRSGNYVKAINNFQQVFDIDPLYPELHLNTGVAWLARGDTTKAEEEFQRELAYYPNNAKVKNNLGVIYEYSYNLTEANNYYRQALLDDPNHLDARINLVRSLLKSGDAYFQMDDLQSAEQYYFEASDIMADDPRPYYKLALISAAKQDWQNSIRHLDESLERDSNYRPAIELKYRLSGMELE